MRRRKVSLRRVFAVPAMLFVIGLTGLIWALLVDGPQDVLAGLAVGAPLGVLGWGLLKRR